MKSVLIFAELCLINKLKFDGISNSRLSYEKMSITCRDLIRDRQAIGDPLTKKKIPLVPFDELILPQPASDDAVSLGLLDFEETRLADLVRET